MTAEEMEVAYCKARRTCMKSFRMWLRDHIQIAQDAVNLGLSPDQVQKLTMAAMVKAEAEISKELDGKVDCIRGLKALNQVRTMPEGVAVK